MMDKVQNSECCMPSSNPLESTVFALFSDIKQPKLLIIYTASNASHIRVMEELAKYLRKCCFVDALLDLVDIPKTKRKVLKVYGTMVV
jgi:hypothetical protein